MCILLFYNAHTERVMENCSSEEARVPKRLQIQHTTGVGGWCGTLSFNLIKARKYLLLVNDEGGGEETPICLTSYRIAIK